MASKTSWKTAVAAVVVATLAVGAGRVVLYEVLASEFMQAQRGSTLLPVSLVTFVYWDAAAPLIAVGVAAAVLARRVDPKPFIAATFGLAVVLGALRQMFLPPVEPLGRLGSVLVTGYELTVIAAAIGLGAWLAQRRDLRAWLSIAALLALTPLLAWLRNVLIVLSIGEIGLIEIPLYIAPVAAPVACLAVAAWWFGSRVPERLGGGPVRGWMALPFAVGLVWCASAPSRVLHLLPDSPLVDFAEYALYSAWLPSTTVVTIACTVFLAARWRSDVDRVRPRLAMAYLAAAALNSGYSMWRSSPAHELGELWAGRGVLELHWYMAW